MVENSAVWFELNRLKRVLIKHCSVKMCQLQNNLEYGPITVRLQEKKTEQKTCYMWAFVHE